MSISKKDLEDGLKRLNQHKNELENGINQLNNQLGQLNREFMMVLGSIETIKQLLGAVVIKQAKTEVKEPKMPTKSQPK